MTRKKGIIRSRRTEFAVLMRLFDVLLSGLTLKFILEFNLLEFGLYQVWWLSISIFAFEFFAELSHLYNAPRGTHILKLALRTTFTWLGVVLILLIISSIYTSFIEINYEQAFWVWIFLVPLELIIWHLILRSIINYFRALGRNTRQVAIIGATSIAGELEEIIKKDTWLGFSFAGFFDDRLAQEEGRHQLNPQQLSGGIQDLISEVNKQNIDIVYITLPLKSEERIKKILEELSDTTAAVFYVPDIFGFDLLRARLENLSGIPVISIHDTPFYGIDGFVKRCFDLIISLLILIIIALPLLVIAIGVKLSSSGPVIFKQLRYGFRGEEICVWKFRTMRVTEDGEPLVQAIKDDPRVTRFGKFIRKTSLDELPQFINVLQGRMSIVGPRPHAVAQNEFYRGQIKGYMLRHKVKPGITGLAQINGFRGETNTIDKMDGRVRHDLEYIRNWSLSLDLKIFFITIIKGFVSKQAY